MPQTDRTVSDLGRVLRLKHRKSQQSTRLLVDLKSFDFRRGTDYRDSPLAVLVDGSAGSGAAASRVGGDAAWPADGKVDSVRNGSGRGCTLTAVRGPRVTVDMLAVDDDEHTYPSFESWCGCCSSPTGAG
jgi:hypothetical protein